METDDSKHLYEVEREMAEYESEGKDDFPHQPMTSLQIHDTISSTGKCSLLHIAWYTGRCYPYSYHTTGYQWCYTNTLEYGRNV